MRAVLYLAASVQGAVLAEGDHVVHALAYSLGPRQRGHDASVTDDLQPNASVRQHKGILVEHIGQRWSRDACLVNNHASWGVYCASGRAASDTSIPDKREPRPRRCDCHPAYM